MFSQLDSWSVILNGSVEVTYPDNRTEILCMGNSFGVSPTMEKEYMKGVMKTKVDDCQVGQQSNGSKLTKQRPVVFQIQMIMKKIQFSSFA